MDYTTMGNDVSVFPYNIYGSKTVLPRPYFRYEPSSYGTSLIPGGTSVDPYGPPGVFGYTTFANGYGEGNLQGHICQCECEKVPEGYGNLTQESNFCWCGKRNSSLCTASSTGRCEAMDVSKVRLR